MIVFIGGAGVMGSGIAQVCAEKGLRVLLYDVSQDAVARALDRIRGFVERGVAKGKYDGLSVKDIMDMITPSDALERAAEAEFVIEAIIEDLDAKKEFFRELEGLVRDDVVVATNTSAISITALSSAFRIPGRFLGMHFFNPVPLMRLVEVVRGLETSDSAVEKTVSLAKRLGKTPVVLSDSPGFLVNRIARPFYLESLRMLEEGLLSHEEIDSLVKGLGFRMGPFELLDLVGLDVNLSVSEYVYEEFFHEPRFRPVYIQKKMVASGRLGRKTGRGFYEYNGKR